MLRQSLGVGKLGGWNEEPNNRNEEGRESGKKTNKQTIKLKRNKGGGGRGWMTASNFYKI
jgi:hypothetical protein